MSLIKERIGTPHSQHLLLPVLHTTRRFHHVLHLLLLFHKVRILDNLIPKSFHLGIGKNVVGFVNVAVMAGHGPDGRISLELG